MVLKTKTTIRILIHRKWWREIYHKMSKGILCYNIYNLDWWVSIGELCIERFCPWGFCPNKILSKRDYVQGVFCPRNFSLEGFCLGEFCPMTVYNIIFLVLSIKYILKILTKPPGWDTFLISYFWTLKIICWIKGGIDESI